MIRPQPDLTEPVRSTRDPFPGNIIPASRISAVSRKVLTFVPDPKIAGIFR